MTRGIRSRAIRSPTASLRSGGTSIRPARVTAPSTTETGTTAPASRLAQTVEISSARADSFARPSRPSSRRMTCGGVCPGSGSPTVRTVVGASSSTDRSVCLPAEAISETETCFGAAESNRWVQRHSRQRATPATWADGPGGPPCTRRIR